MAETTSIYGSEAALNAGDELMPPSASDLVLDCVQARAHRDIRNFVELCDRTRGSGLIDFEMLQRREFIPYWSFLAILRWDVARQDFVFVFFGSDLVAKVGADFTGRPLSAGGEVVAAHAREANRRALSEHGPVYFSDTLGWRGKSYIRQYGVIMPLRRKDTVTETVTRVCYP